MRKTSKKNVTTEVIKKHIYDNIKEYAIASILFIIGIILGVIFINNANDLQITQITNYLSNFSGSLKTDYEIDNSELLKNSVRDNAILAIVMVCGFNCNRVTYNIWNSNFQRILHGICYFIYNYNIWIRKGDNLCCL